MRSPSFGSYSFLGIACVELARGEDRGEFLKGVNAFDGGEFGNVLVLRLLTASQLRL